MHPLVRLHAATRRLGRHAAVASVSLAVQAGEFFALLGRSGCGKSTLLQRVAGFEWPND